MASDGRNLRGSLSLDELIALNDEILALVRAGVPLELGLRQNVGGLSRRLHRLTDSVADRLAKGVDLGTAVRQADAGMPPIYQAILAAGLKSGRLDKALEGLTRAARHVAALRHLLLVAMVYPLIVFLLAYGLFIGMLLYVAPTLLMFAEGKPGALLSALDSIRGSIGVWGPIAPLVVLVPWLVWLYQSNRALSIQRGGGAWNVGLPMVHGMVRDAHYAMFAELLALLVEHELPLNESLLIAATAAGDRKLARAAGN
jgi:general secretion pathway protein F